MRRVALVSGALLVAVAAIVATAIVFRFRIVEAVIRRELVRAGFAEVRFVVERVDHHGIAISGLEAGQALRADAIEVDLALRRLPGLPIDRLRIAHARVDLTTLAKAKADTQTSSLPLALLPLLEIDDARIVLPSAAGTSTVQLRSQRSTDGGSAATVLDGTVEGAAKAALHAEARLAGPSTVSMTVRAPTFDIRQTGFGVAGGANGSFDFETAGLDVASAKGRLELSLTDASVGDSDLGRISSTLPLEITRRDGHWLAKVSNASIRAPRYDLDATGISVDASEESIELEIARLDDTAAARRFTPLSLHLKWLPTASTATYAGDVAMAAGRVAVRASGTYDAAARRARIKWTLPRTRFDPQGLELTDVSPLLASVAARGTVDAAADLEWTAGKGTSASASVDIEDLSLDAPSVRVDGLSGTIALTNLFPPATSAPQTLRAHAINPGVAFTDATLRWGFEPAEGGRGSRLAIERFETVFADGRLVVENARLDPTSAANRIDFRIENADVGRLFEISGLQDTSATGRLGGVIPVVVQAGAVAIPKGELEAKNGVLQMRSQKVAGILAGGGQSAALLLDVLRDFHYDDLVVTIDKSLAGDASVQVHLEGNNPAVLEGHPFRVNLNVSGNLDRLVASLAEVARLSDRAVRATVRGVHPEAR